MTSGGGLTTLETAVAAPVRLVESGPAGGAILASHLARDLDLGDVLSFDMGGTTAKLCVIDGGRPLHSRTFEVARSYRFKQGSGLPVRIPVIEMVEIGAGGGSIAGVDDLERIQVGPGSAGSEPGPAAYGRGGDEPTVTDADVVLGRIDPQLFAGGSISLDRGRAESRDRIPRGTTNWGSTRGSPRSASARWWTRTCPTPPAPTRSSGGRAWRDARSSPSAAPPPSTPRAWRTSWRWTAF